MLLDVKPVMVQDPQTMKKVPDYWQASLKVGKLLFLASMRQRTSHRHYSVLVVAVRYGLLGLAADVRQRGNPAELDSNHPYQVQG